MLFILHLLTSYIKGVQLIIKFLKPSYHESITYKCIGGSNQWDSEPEITRRRTSWTLLKKKSALRKLRKPGRQYSAQIL